LKEKRSRGKEQENFKGGIGRKRWGKGCTDPIDLESLMDALMTLCKVTASAVAYIHHSSTYM